MRVAPTSLRSGATRGPTPLTRWQLAHSPLPANSAFPRAPSPRRVAAAGAPGFEALLGKLRRYATIAIACPSEKPLGAIVVPGMPARTIAAISLADVPL